LGVNRSIGGLIGHNGSVSGFQTFVGYQADNGVTVIVLTNLELAPNTYLARGYPADEMAKLISMKCCRGLDPRRRHGPLIYRRKLITDSDLRPGL
jgi:hypothetical protein